MSQIVTPTPSTEQTRQPATSGTQPAAVIATRQRCDADGVGLSHYILMDRKPAQ